MPAPIALFVYNRLEHTKKTIDSLRDNYLAECSELHIFSDGPRNDSIEDESRVCKLRKYIHSIQGFKIVHIYESRSNLGLATSIISGVTDIVNRYGSVIVIEDDLITSKYFLTFMNEGLGYYAKDDRVISIHGYVYPCKESLPPSFFLKGADCWGWATWKRGWNLFEADGTKLLNEITAKNLKEEFNFGNSYDYVGMLERQIAGKINSWAIRWYASAFIKNKLTLYPGKTLVQNIGFDGSGTHCANIETYFDNLHQDKLNIETEVKPSKLAFRAFQNYFIRTNSDFFKLHLSIFDKMKHKILNFFHNNN